ncbi:phage portal protein [Ketogulonicigenium vulgare]|uniref:phage portal protein n=1 Tax=Ketogulonicigenium vulgare TaxID=92945 RepID=UPI00235838B6|nr:phage portal protein [Ketogulonicigenium vulgare]
MGFFGNMALAIAPSWAAKRERARLVAMHYRASRLGQRSDSLRAASSDANVAGRDRARIAFYMRDMVRNSPFAARAQAVIANNVVGDGIIPKININAPKQMKKAKKVLQKRALRLIETSLDTTAIDWRGLQNLYGLQRQAINTIVEAGEVLIRRRDIALDEADGKLPLKIEVMEPDFLDTSRRLAGVDGNEVRDGIEYDANDRRVAYWLFSQHPGGEFRPGKFSVQSERVPADQILHVFRPDRPGQERGISWFTPVAEKLLNLDDYEDAQLMRQKIAACFAVFRKLGTDGEASPELGETLTPGSIMDIGPDEEVTFGSPPVASGDDQFKNTVLRASAVGMGLSYEALTGDLSGVNFSSARIGRLEMDRNISSWQWLMMVPMLLQPMADWILEAWAELDGEEFEASGLSEMIYRNDGFVTITWVPPVRLLVDPAREFAALREAVRSGFQSRQGVVRQLGVDPERLLQEQLQDKQQADDLGLPFDSDPRADVSRQAKGPDKEDDGNE